MRSPCLKASRSGFILVAVLFISTLLLSSAVSFAWFARVEMKRASAEEFALVSRSLASIVCQTVGVWIANDDNNFDSELEYLYTPNYPILLWYGNWEVAIQIVPQDRLIPINSIFLPDGVTLRKEYEYPWEEFWKITSDDSFATTMLDFLDRDTEARPGSVEEEFFVNREIGDLSELLRLEEIKRDFLYREYAENAPTFDRYFTVYCDEKININLAPKEVLSILDEEMGEDIADSIITYRTENKIENEKDLLKIPGFPMAVHTRLSNVIAYKSNYFLLDMNVSDGNRERKFKVMVKRVGRMCMIVNWSE